MTDGISGSMSTNSSTYIVARVSYSETYDVSSNTSSVTATLAYRRTNTYAYTTQSTGTFYVNINGTNYSVYSGLFQIPGNDNEWHTVGSKTITGIEHNANGSKSITIGGSHSGNISPYYLNFNKSETVALTTIPRASVPTCTPSTVTLSSTTTQLLVNTNRVSSSFTHTITVTVGSYTSTQTGIMYNAGFNLPYSLIGEMTAPTMTGNVVMTTYSGSTQIGSPQSVTFTIRPDSTLEYASVSSVTLSDTNTTTADLETSGHFIRGYSNLQAVIGVAVTGSYTTLANCKVTCGNVSQSFPLSGTTGSVTFTTNQITSSSMTIEVTDNRGAKTTTTQAISLIDYRPPSFSEVSIYRVNSSGQQTETGEYIHYSVKLNCFDGSFGQQGNALTLRYKYKLTSASDYGSETYIDAHTGTGTGSYTTYTFTGITGGGNLLYTNEYNIQFKITDKLTSSYSSELRLNQGIPVYAYGEDHFDVYGEIHVHDRSDPSVYRTYGAKGTAWTSFGTATGSNRVTLTHTNYEELLVCIKYAENANYVWLATATVPKAMLSSSDLMVMLTSRIAPTSANDFGAVAKVNTSEASISASIANRTSVISTSELTVYYR